MGAQGMKYPNPVIHHCVVCGNPFPAHFTGTKCCSDPHAKIYYQRKKKEQKLLQAQIRVEQEKFNQHMVERKTIGGAIKHIDTKRFFSTLEVSRMYGIPFPTVQYWVRNGYLNHVRVKNNGFCILAEELPKIATYKLMKLKEGSK